MADSHNNFAASLKVSMYNEDSETLQWSTKLFLHIPTSNPTIMTMFNCIYLVPILLNNILNVVYLMRINNNTRS